MIVHSSTEMVNLEVSKFSVHGIGLNIACNYVDLKTFVANSQPGKSRFVDPSCPINWQHCFRYILGVCS